MSVIAKMVKEECEKNIKTIVSVSQIINPGLGINVAVVVIQTNDSHLMAGEMV